MLLKVCVKNGKNDRKKNTSTLAGCCDLQPLVFCTQCAHQNETFIRGIFVPPAGMWPPPALASARMQLFSLRRLESHVQLGCIVGNGWHNNSLEKQKHYFGQNVVSSFISSWLQWLFRLVRIRWQTVCYKLSEKWLSAKTRENHTGGRERQPVGKVHSTEKFLRMPTRSGQIDRQRRETLKIRCLTIVYAV